MVVSRPGGPGAACPHRQPNGSRHRLGVVGSDQREASAPVGVYATRTAEAGSGDSSTGSDSMANRAIT